MAAKGFDYLRRGWRHYVASKSESMKNGSPAYLLFGFEWLWRCSFSTALDSSAALGSYGGLGPMWTTNNPMWIGFALGMGLAFLLREKLYPLNRKRSLFGVLFLLGCAGTVAFYYSLSRSAAGCLMSFLLIDTLCAFYCLMWWESFTGLSTKTAGVILLGSFIVMCVGNLLTSSIFESSDAELPCVLALIFLCIALIGVRKASLNEVVFDTPDFSIQLSRQGKIAFIVIGFTYSLAFSVVAKDSLGQNAYAGVTNFGSWAAMVLLAVNVLGLPEKSPLVGLRYTCFPVFVTGFVLLAAAQDAVVRDMALGFIHCGFYYFSMFMVLFMLYVASETDIPVIVVGSLVEFLAHIGMSGGLVAAEGVGQIVPLNGLVQSVLAIICFLLLFIAVFLLLRQKDDVFLWGILKQRSDEAYFLDLTIKRCDALADAHRLTAREREVLIELAQGRKPRQISDEFVLSVRTVQTHINSIYRKLKVHSNEELLDLVRLQPIDDIILAEE